MAEQSRVAIKPAMRRVLSAIAGGGVAQDEHARRLGGIGWAVISGAALERGWARIVCRRDGTRPYALTATGRAVLRGAGEGQS